jgi:hypothetical protein
LLDGEKVAGASVARRVAQLAHRTSFNLTDALTGEVEVFTNFFKGARFAPIKTKAQLQNLAFALVERSQESLNLFGEQRSGCYFEGAFS